MVYAGHSLTGRDRNGSTEVGKLNRSIERLEGWPSHAIKEMLHCRVGREFVPGGIFVRDDSYDVVGQFSSQRSA
jgi:hypothetical protein